jgi:hypothetical protein
MALPITSISFCVSYQFFFLQREEGTSFKPGWVLPSSALFTADSLPLFMVISKINLIILIFAGKPRI